MPEKRILLVEDEPTTREILTEALRREGYAVDSVATAGAATTCLESIPYALVMADRVLPDGDGIDIADAAAQLGSKTLVVSGYLSDLPAGVADRHELLSKQSANTEMIVAAVRRAIGTPRS
jgi:DNA-binding response OmpR family regulator